MSRREGCGVELLANDNSKEDSMASVGVAAEGVETTNDQPLLEEDAGARAEEDLTGGEWCSVD